VARFVHEVYMRWSDMDAYRHVNNSAYLAYLEQARVAMFFHRHEGFNAGTVISRHEIDYLHPIVYHPKPLRVEVWIENVGGARFTVRYEIFDDDVLTARASTTCVTFDFITDRPRRLTAEEHGILVGFSDTK
jgi:acyl-CoA thioester hydrolase